VLPCVKSKRYISFKNLFKILFQIYFVDNRITLHLLPRAGNDSPMIVAKGTKSLTDSLQFIAMLELRLNMARRTVPLR